MCLNDIISIVGEGTLVRVFNSDYEEIAKENIPEDKEVETIFPANCGQLNIILK